jgi:cytochrome c-type biogenesis protein CcmH
MNITFWILMILMLLLAIGLLVYPLLKARQFSPLAYKESNLKINDEKIKELDIDLEEGRIDQLYYRAAREELDRELLIDIPAESKETASLHYANTAKRHPALALVIAVFVPMLALLLYLDLGMHNASDESFAAVNEQQQPQPQTAQPSVEEMTRQLQARIEKNGGTVKEWIMLARAHKFLGENEQAANAFAVALEQEPENAQLMLERAEVLALSNNRVFSDEANALVTRAYELDPDNPNTLWFIGVAEFQQGHYHQAIQHVKKLLPLVAGDEEVMKSVVSVVAKSREALIAEGEDMPELAQILGIKEMMAKAATSASRPTGMTTADSSSPQSSAAGNATRLQVAVDISDQVRQKFDANDTVFVYAKAKQGPRMPLAVQRLTLAALPTSVVLDDSMAMVAGMNLSAFDQLVVSARVSKSGSAIAQSGDYIGQLDVNDKNAGETLNIDINTVVP